MLEEIFNEVYTKFKLHFYKGIFGELMERDGSLSATEVFSAEVIYALQGPTIREFAEYIGISQPNATYKVNSLMKKGYVEKVNSDIDKREYILKMGPKFYEYCAISDVYIKTVMGRIKNRFSSEDCEKFESMLFTLSRELMPEENDMRL